MAHIIAHDLGTTGNKATLYDRDGRLVGSVFYGYETEYAHTGWAEQNPENWWLAVCRSTRGFRLQRTGPARGGAGPRAERAGGRATCCTAATEGRGRLGEWPGPTR